MCEKHNIVSSQFKQCFSEKMVNNSDYMVIKYCSRAAPLKCNHLAERLQIRFHKSSIHVVFLFVSQCAETSWDRYFTTSSCSVTAPHVHTEDKIISALSHSTWCEWDEGSCLVNVFVRLLHEGGKFKAHRNLIWYGLTLLFNVSTFNKNGIAPYKFT